MNKDKFKIDLHTNSQLHTTELNEDEELVDTGEINQGEIEDYNGMHVVEVDDFTVPSQVRMHPAYVVKEVDKENFFIVYHNGIELVTDK